MGNKKNKVYHKKRKEVGKRKRFSLQSSPEKDKENLTTTPNAGLDTSKCSSASSKKLADITPRKQRRKLTGYRIVDIELLSDVFKLLSCPLCFCQTLSLSECFAKKKGIAYALEITLQ